jgi:drug/metabolite transporter (DMT)-like permease
MLPALLVSTIILIVIGFVMRFENLVIPVRDLLLCFPLGAGLSGITNCLFIIASRHLVAAEVTLFMLLEFSLGPIWVWLFVGEAPTQLTVLGGLLVMSAVTVRAAIQLTQARHLAQRMKRRPVPIRAP